MKGTNKLVLNEPTMIEAVQPWVAENIATDDGIETIVTGIKSDMNGKSFIVSIETKEPAGEGELTEFDTYADEWPDWYYGAIGIFGALGIVGIIWNFVL